MNQVNWKSDLQGLVDENRLTALRDLIHKRKKQRSMAVTLVYVFLFIVFVAIIAGAWGFTDWKNSKRADIANGVIAFSLALSTLVGRALPAISKGEVDKTVGTVVLRPTFVKIEAEVGGRERLQQWVALLAAVALFAVILLKLSVPDTGNSETKEVGHAARHVSAYGRPLSP